jgi:hypothetical protein
LRNDYNYHSLDFLGKECKNDCHKLCAHQWKGLGLEVICNCDCHKKIVAGNDVGYNHNNKKKDCHWTGSVFRGEFNK